MTTPADGPRCSGVRAYHQARLAGLPPASAARWPEYLAMKEARGETPITLAEAVRQKLVAIVHAG